MLLVYVCVLLQVGAGLHLETPTKNYRDDVASSEAASSEEHLHVRKAGDAAGSSQVHPGEQVLAAGEFGRSRRYIGDGYIGGLKGSNVDEEEDPVTVILVFYEQLMILRRSLPAASHLAVPSARDS
nr:uncharacterized protein LOC128690614 [Cherax quadricarinatus]